MQHNAHVLQFYRRRAALEYLSYSIKVANERLALLHRYPWLCPVSG